MISSSSVYPDDSAQPFLENSQLGENKFWGQYGLDKIAAEKRLLELVPKQKRRYYGRLKENQSGY